MWFYRRYAVPPEGEDDLTAALEGMGTLGTEVRAEEARLVVLAWFTAPPSETGLPGRPGEERGGVALLDEGWQEAQDWLASYRRHVQPVTVGRFVLDPREPDQPAPPVPAGGFLLRLPARTAFGTGSHATTRLALSWLDELVTPGMGVLDVGCGSGVLTLAAAALGAAPCGFDHDPVAALVAGQYARLNHRARAAGRLWAGAIEALAATARFDLVVVNVLPHLVLPVAGEIVARLRPAGTLVVSGLLIDEEDAVRGAWEDAGVRPLERRREEEWSSYRMERAA